MKKTLYIIGGVLQIFFAVSHAFFYKMFDWKETLSSLSSINRGIMLVLNNCAIVLFLWIAVLSFFFANELSTTKIGRAVSIFVAAFFLIRAVEEPIYFGIYDIGGIVNIALCMLAVSLYVIPLFISERQPVHSPA